MYVYITCGVCYIHGTWVYALYHTFHGPYCIVCICIQYNVYIHTCIHVYTCVYMILWSILCIRWCIHHIMCIRYNHCTYHVHEYTYHHCMTHRIWCRMYVYVILYTYPVRLYAHAMLHTWYYGPYCVYQCICHTMIRILVYRLEWAFYATHSIPYIPHTIMMIPVHMMYMYIPL